MGADNNQIARPLKALRNFKKYEDLFYSYLKKNSQNFNNLDFYLVPKNYIRSFIKRFDYIQNISELNNLNLYHDTDENLPENKIIEKDIINNLSTKYKNIIESNFKLDKINNQILFTKEKSEMIFKLNKEGLFIPLSLNIWDKLSRYYGYDVVLKRKGYARKGELFILTEEKRIDVFFKNIKTKDIIYHFCFKMDDNNNFNKLKNYFKANSAKELLHLLNIKYIGNQYKNKRFACIDMEVPTYVNGIGGHKLNIYYLDSYIFKENRDFETIIFDVEKGLPKPNIFYQQKSKDEIFKTLFNTENFQSPKKILMSNFNIEQNTFYNAGKKSLIQGLVLAYKNHYPIVVFPDMIWLLFLQGFARYVDKYHDLLREKFVNFEGKKALEVKKLGIFPEEASQETWQEIIDNFITGIKRYTGEDIISNLQSDFTTTEEVILATSQATIMSAMQNYFDYELGMGGCGVSRIILEGTVEDWENMKSKFDYLLKKNLGLNFWIKELLPIIDNIIATKNYFKTHKTINNEMIKFWKNIIRIKDEKNDFYDPFVINGWITKFIPNLNGNQLKPFNELKLQDIPDQILGCPLKLTVYNLDGTKTIHSCELASGFFGMSQNVEYHVRPVIGYALISNSSEKYPLTKEEKKAIFQDSK